MSSGFNGCPPNALRARMRTEKRFRRELRTRPAVCPDGEGRFVGSYSTECRKAASVPYFYRPSPPPPLKRHIIYMYGRDYLSDGCQTEGACPLPKILNFAFAFKRLDICPYKRLYYVSAARRGSAYQNMSPPFLLSDFKASVSISTGSSPKVSRIIFSLRSLSSRRRYAR